MNYMSFLNFSKEVSSTQTVAEKLESILTTGVVGYLLVFVILAVIWFIIALVGKFFDKKPKEKKTAEAIPADPSPDVAEATAADDSAIVAAIVAAISSYEDKPAGNFRVVSFRKKN